jgi:F-type H+-transporting ATPase subunit a
MLEHKLGYVEWLTVQFYALIDQLGLHLQHHAMDHVWMALFVMLFCAIFFGYWRSRFGVYPTFIQQALEAYYRFIENMMKDMIGPTWRRYFPLVGTLGIFILLSNLMGLIPIFKSPTSNINTTVACALTVFVYYHFQGIREHGLIKYLKHFAGPVWWLAPLFIPVELIGHFSRPLSLSIRLFGNIFGEDTIILILFGLIPFLIPLPIMCLAIFTSLVQTLVFVMLASVYIGGAVAHEESHHEEHTVGHLAPAPEAA